MLIDVKKMFGDRDGVREINFSFDFSEENLPGFSMPTPCVGVAIIEPDYETLKLEVTAKAVVSSECARCLEPVNQEVVVNRTIVIYKDALRDQDDSIPFTAQDKLDLREFVFTEIFTEIPVILLCDENCKGMCPTCGNLRSKGCTCEQNSGDERLAILKQLLS